MPSTNRTNLSLEFQTTHWYRYEVKKPKYIPQLKLQISDNSFCLFFLERVCKHNRRTNVGDWILELDKQWKKAWSQHTHVWGKAISQCPSIHTSQTPDQWDHTGTRPRPYWEYWLRSENWSTGRRPVRPPAGEAAGRWGRVERDAGFSIK